MKMETINVPLKDRGYAIRIGCGLLDKVGELARAAVGARARHAVVITNSTVDALYGLRTMRSLRGAGFVAAKAIIADGERYKTLATARRVYDFLIQHRIERSGLIIALGGGVAGDLAGFVAGTYLRGIDLVHMPTTLLAQIDSSVGGKTAVNHPLGKNLIGVFHQPRLVVIDPETLGSLPARQFRAGIFEAIKYGVIRDRVLFDRIASRMGHLLELDTDELRGLITRCCAIKSEVVARDEREGDLRRILNFGHTVGHALEAVTRYSRFYHGEAVAHGMRAASRVAQKLGLLDHRQVRVIDETINGVGRLPGTKNLALGDIMAAMYHDKKAEGGRLALVLPVRIGRVVIRTDVPQQLVRSALKEVLA